MTSISELTFKEKELYWYIVDVLRWLELIDKMEWDDILDYLQEG